MPEVVALLQRAQSTDAALVAIAELLDADKADVMLRLARFDLLSLTRSAGAARLRRLTAFEEG